MVEDARPCDRRVGEHFDVDTAGDGGELEFGDVVGGSAGGGGLGDDGDANGTRGGRDVEVVVEVVDAVYGGGGFADDGLAVGGSGGPAGDDAGWG